MGNSSHITMERSIAGRLDLLYPESPSYPSERPLLLLTCLFMWELCVLVISVAIYAKGDHPITALFSGISGMLQLAVSVAFLIAQVVILHQYLASTRLRSRRFRMVMIINIVMVLCILATAESVVRAGTRGATEGEIWRWRVLVPKSWEKVALYETELLDQRARRLSYLTYDDLMGWTNAPNKRSANGLYYSSLEGIRAPHEGVSFSKSTKKTRIALVGDSFTFGEDVTYEQSWGNLLEKALGPDYEVLNFGVGGYGVDQAYLRYEKDVRQWKPKIVIFSLISDDVERSMRLYEVLNPGWLDFPFSKPRFILRDGNLKKINVPPLTPGEIFSRGSIAELPFLEYDRGYKPSLWQSSFIQHSYFARAVMTLFPPWEAGSSDTSDSALVSVNASILKAFAQMAESERTIPILVYFPQKNAAELSGTTHRLSSGINVLQEAGMPYTDLSSCLMPLKPTERFADGNYHYSPQGNAKVAQCLTKVVNDALAASTL